MRGDAGGEGTELPGAARSLSRSLSRPRSRSLSRCRCRSPVRSCRRLSRADAALWRAAGPVAGAGGAPGNLIPAEEDKKIQLNPGYPLLSGQIRTFPNAERTHVDLAEAALFLCPSFSFFFPRYTFIYLFTDLFVCASHRWDTRVS